MLDGVEDPFNFGQAVRSLYAAGGGWAGAAPAQLVERRGDRRPLLGWCVGTDATAIARVRRMPPIFSKAEGW